MVVRMWCCWYDHVALLASLSPCIPCARVHCSGRHDGAAGHSQVTDWGLQMLVVLVWLGVFSSLILFCWELAWKLQEVHSKLFRQCMQHPAAHP